MSLHQYDTRIVLAFVAMITGAVLLPSELPSTSHGAAAVSGQEQAVPAGAANPEPDLEQATSAYDAVRYGGNPLELCLRAHAVTLAHLHANDPAGYREWQAQESRHCNAAGFRIETETAILVPSERVAEAKEESARDPAGRASSPERVAVSPTGGT